LTPPAPGPLAEQPPADFLGDGVRWGVAPLGNHEAALYPEEAASVARAVPKRRREFSAGRELARRLLAELGVEPGPIVPGADRAPVWPPGVVGSLSHAEGCVFVAVARADRLRALGVDVEGAAPLEEPLWPTVLTPAERAWLATRPASERGRLAKQVFSAKECAYKTWYPLTGRVLDFSEVHLDLDPGVGFVARPPADVAAAAGGPLAGRLHVGSAFIWSASRLEP